eukprot:RCo009084
MCVKRSSPWAWGLAMLVLLLHPEVLLGDGVHPSSVHRHFRGNGTAPKFKSAHGRTLRGANGSPTGICGDSSVLCPMGYGRLVPQTRCTSGSCTQGDCCQP